MGIDEVGRGPLAGPVSLCGVWMKKDEYMRLKKNNSFKGLRDSKGLSEKSREEWYKKILKWKREGVLYFSYRTGSVNNIDERGISPTIKNVIRIILKGANLKPNQLQILLDGSLYAPKEYNNQKTIIKGDEKEAIISLASIVAKIRRDHWIMKKGTEGKYKKYGFEIHKGYGTEMHRKAIKKYGLSDLHRKSFCKNLK